MRFSQKKYWISAVIRNPMIAKWYSHWKSSLNGKRSALGDELPWMTYGAIDWLSKNLTKNMSLFEWGSGGSTLFFSKYVRQVITIEHDSAWYHNVVQILDKKEIKNASINLIEPVQTPGIDKRYMSTGREYEGYSFEKYVRMIDSHPDESFDVVVVDGRARTGCMMRAISKIRKGGILLLDNSERDEYRDGWDLVQAWKNIKIWGPGPYNNYPWETRIWRKGGF